MPVSRHSQRANAPLTARDRRVLLLVACAAVVALASLAGAFALRSSSPKPRPGCLVVDVPSTMGGARVHVCGRAARSFCRSEGQKASVIAAACRRQGLAAGP